VPVPHYILPHQSVDIARNAILLDTNVLVDAFWHGTCDHKPAARYLLEEADFQLLVPAAVVVEAWGVLERKCGWESGWEMIRWVAEEGYRVAVLCRRDGIDAELSIQHRLSLDHVDAHLAILATILTRACNLEPPIPVATRDFRDFTKVMASEDVRLTLHDYTQPT